jgi:hypothetical protein
MALSKKDQQSLDELNAYLASRDEKTNKVSDKQILANAKRSISSKRILADPKVKARH